MATDAAPLTRDDLRDELQRALKHCATKADLADLRDEMRRAMAHYATKADVTDMRGDLQATRAEFKADLRSQTRWMVVAMLGFVSAASAVTGLIVRSFSWWPGANARRPWPGP